MTWYEESSAVEIVLIGLCALILGVSAILVLIRIVRGPSVLDRTISSEVLISTFICALGLSIATTRLSSTLPILISLSLTGFVGSVAVARFVARDHDRNADDDGDHDRPLGPLEKSEEGGGDV